jgi:hypothetical protein
MPIRQSAPDAVSRHNSTLDKGFTALGALVAVAVTVLFLTLTGAHRSNPMNSVTPVLVGTAGHSASPTAASPHQAFHWEDAGIGAGGGPSEHR